MDTLRWVIEILYYVLRQKYPSNICSVIQDKKLVFIDIIDTQYSLTYSMVLSNLDLSELLLTNQITLISRSFWFGHFVKIGRKMTMLWSFNTRPK